MGSVTDAYVYDSNGLFASHTAKFSGTALYSESVMRDADGRITQKTETIGTTPHVWGYAFDATGRLTDVNAGMFAVVISMAGPTPLRTVALKPCSDLRASGYRGGIVVAGTRRRRDGVERSGAGPIPSFFDPLTHSRS